MSKKIRFQRVIRNNFQTNENFEFAKHFVTTMVTGRSTTTTAFCSFVRSSFIRANVAFLYANYFRFASDRAPVLRCGVPHILFSAHLIRFHNVICAAMFCTKTGSGWRTTAYKPGKPLSDSVCPINFTLRTRWFINYSNTRSKRRFTVRTKYP